MLLIMQFSTNPVTSSISNPHFVSVLCSHTQYDPVLSFCERSSFVFSYFWQWWHDYDYQ